MLESAHPLAKLLRRDRRYPFDAYLFVFEALRYAHEELGMGSEQPSEEIDPDEESGEEQHLSGQELCEAIRHYAMDQFGLMAQMVVQDIMGEAMKKEELTKENIMIGRIL